MTDAPLVIKSGLNLLKILIFLPLKLKEGRF